MSHPIYCFAELELDTERYELRRSGHPIHLERIPMQVLLLLIENSGKIVHRETIVEKVWGKDVFFEAEHSINTAINKLRHILRDDPRNPRFIRTIIGQGYCLIAKVNVLDPVSHAFSSKSLSQGHGTLAVTVLPMPSVETELVGSVAMLTRHSGSITAEPETLEIMPASEVGNAVITPPKSSHIVRWPLYAALLCLLAGSLALTMHWLRNGREDATLPPENPIHSIAILPFRNLSSTNDQDYLAEGLTDQLTTRMARNSSLRVISQRSAMQFKAVEKPTLEIARLLKVEAVIEGSYLHEGNRVRITAQLIDTQRDQHIWAQVYEESDKDLLLTQDRVIHDIAQQVTITLGSILVEPSARRTASAYARESFLRGRHFWNQRTTTSVANSLKSFQDAIRKDPNYAEAYAAMAEAYVVKANYGGDDPNDDLLKAQYAAERALELDSSLGQAHTALGAVHVERDWDWETAEQEYKRAIQLDPQDATAHHWYSLHLSRMGKMKDAEAEIQRAIAIDPLSPIINTDAAATSYWAGDFKHALARVDNVLALDPDFTEAHITRAKILVEMHRFREAQAEYAGVQKRSVTPGYLTALQFHSYAVSGNREEALSGVHQLEAKWPSNNVSGLDVAMVYCGLNDVDNAVRWFDIAYREHKGGIGMVGVDHVYQNCHSDPRFKKLLANLHLSGS